MVYLRARYFAPSMGRFLTRDNWGGSANQPMSYNRWNYVNGNPVNYIDPSGHIAQGSEAFEAEAIIQRLKPYRVSIFEDWGPYTYMKQWRNLIDNSNGGICTISVSGWHTGEWSIDDLRVIEKGVYIMRQGISALGGDFNNLVNPVEFRPKHGRPGSNVGYINFNVDAHDEAYRYHAVIHEMGHIIDLSHRPQIINFYMAELGASCIGSEFPYDCNEEFSNGLYDPGPYSGSVWKWHPDHHDPQPPGTHMPRDYASNGPMEDLADTFAAVVSEAYLRSGDNAPGIRFYAELVYNPNNHDIGRRRKVMKDILSTTW